MIIRRERNSRFTVIGNHIAEDARLSFEAVGLMTYLLSRPDDWRVHVSQLQRRGGCGRDKTRKLIAELIEAGYVVREQIRSEDRRRIEGVNYVVYDEPKAATGQETENPSPEGQGTDCQAPENQAPENPSPYLIRKDTKEGLSPNKREARASERDASTSSAGQPHEPEPESEPDACTDDPAKFERRVKKLAADLNWPRWAKSSTSWTVAQFAKLTDAERAEAERRAPQYIATTGKSALSLGVYFQDRKWTDLPDPAEEKPVALDAPPFGPLWMAARLKKLFSGMEIPALPKLTSFQRHMIETGEWDEAVVRREQQAKSGWPGVNAMHQRAVDRKGVSVAPELETFAALMEAVPVGSEAFEAWRLEHERRGWPWIPDPGRQRVVYFPRGGPAGLEAFEQAIRDGHVTAEQASEAAE